MFTQVVMMIFAMSYFVCCCSVYPSITDDLHQKQMHVSTFFISFIIPYFSFLIGNIMRKL